MDHQKSMKKNTMPHSKGPQLQLPDGEPLDIPASDLLLDPQNLRLLETIGEEIRKTKAKLLGQPAMQKRLYDAILSDPIFDLQGLVASIANNGFLKHDRLIVARYDHTSYLVLEGNRRLAAVRFILQKYGRTLNGLKPDVKNSLSTLPCFLLKGGAIQGSEETLAEYRRAAEIYIGIRHLMGAKSWEPASRYEFQARLILEEGWTVSDVAERFGRKKAAVERDLKAQLLYRDFSAFEKRNELNHSLTYNAFAEAARAPSVMKWLKWSSPDLSIKDKKCEEAFFGYLISRLKTAARSGVPEDETVDLDESAELIVRRLRDMLKLHDDDIDGALLDHAFETAEVLYADRKEGAFAKRIASYIRGLKRVTSSELSETQQDSKALLLQLIVEAKNILKLLGGALKKK